MQFVKHQHVDPGELTAHLLYARFRSGKAQHFSARGPGQNKGEGGFSAAGRAEEQKTRQVRTIEQRLYLGAQVALPHEVFQFRRTQTFRQRTVHEGSPGC